MKTLTLVLTLFSASALFCQFPGAGNALDFQTNRQIIAPTGANLIPSASFDELTVEAWVYWRGTVSGSSGIMEGRGSAIHFEITNNNNPGMLRVRVNNNNGAEGVVINNAVPKNQWVHLAFTYENFPVERVRIYKNGALIGEQSGASGAGLNFNNWLRFGISCCTGDAGRPFNGLIDEIRVWYKAKTIEEIRAEMCKKLNGTETDLTLYYRLDEIVGNTVSDLSGNGNDGTLHNFNLETHHVPSGAAIGNQSWNWYDLDWNNQALYVESIQGDSIKVDEINGNPNGVQIYHVNELPNTTNGINGLGTNDHYYGVFMANGAETSYDLTYFYGNNPAFKASSPSLDEGELELFNRNDNSYEPWVAGMSSIDFGTQSLTVTSTFRQSYILGLNDLSPLPIELIDFTAVVKNNNSVVCRWSTISETNNEYFDVERSHDGVNFKKIGTVAGAGNSSQLLNYQFTDVTPMLGTSYYRLKQTDYNGDYSYANIKSVTLLNEKAFTVFPNPVAMGEGFNIKISPAQHFEQLRVIDVTGKIVHQAILDNNSLIDISTPLNKGSYIVSLSNQETAVMERLIVR